MGTEGARPAAWPVLAAPLFALLAACGLPGGGDEAIVYRDTWGVPHIYSDSAEAGLYASGWAMAEDRLSQLLENYLFGLGEYAAAFGAGDGDRWVRSDLRSIGVEPSLDVDLRASNQIALAADQTTFGAAALIIDPHLSWLGRHRYWEVRLHAVDIHISGFATAGFPYVNPRNREPAALGRASGQPAESAQECGGQKGHCGRDEPNQDSKEP